MTKKIDARLLLPGQKFIDPLSGDRRVLELRNLLVVKTPPRADGTPVVAVRLGVTGTTGGWVVTVDPGTEVELVDPAPTVETVQDPTTGAWTVRVNGTPVWGTDAATTPAQRLVAGRQYLVLPGAKAADPSVSWPLPGEVVTMSSGPDADGDIAVTGLNGLCWVMPEYLAEV